MGVENQLEDRGRQDILNALSTKVEQFIKKRGGSLDRWHENLAEARSSIVDSYTTEEFEKNITLLLRSLDISHVGFYREDLERCSAKMALCATYMETFMHGQRRWAFQDVHRGGPADLASIRPGDVLVGVGSTRSTPPDHPVFKMGSEVRLTLEGKNGKVSSKTVVIPHPKQRNQLPFAEPGQVAYGRRISSEIGCLTVSMFPGSIGIDVANEIESQLHLLGKPHRLIVDLRGNGGGGLGFLRLINLLETDAVPVGTFQQYRSPTESSSGVAPYFSVDEVPRSRKELAGLAFRYFGQMVGARLRKQALSVQLRARPRRNRSYDGRVMVLMNRHTASASEMLIAHLRARHLALLVGEPTAGRVVGGGKSRLPHGYWVVLPTGSYQTSLGETLEGSPISPDVHIPFEPGSALEGEDRQMEKAIEVVESL